MLQEDPLRPAVELDVGGGDGAAVVVAQAQLAQLRLVALDVVLGGLARVRARLHGVLLGGQAERVETHRVQHVAPGHPQVAAQHVGADEAQRVPDVQPGAGRVGEHVQQVDLVAVGGVGVGPRARTGWARGTCPPSPTGPATAARSARPAPRCSGRAGCSPRLAARAPARSRAAAVVSVLMSRSWEVRGGPKTRRPLRHSGVRGRPRRGVYATLSAARPREEVGGPRNQGNAAGGRPAIGFAYAGRRAAAPSHRPRFPARARRRRADRRRSARAAAQAAPQPLVRGADERHPALERRVHRGQPGGCGAAGRGGSGRRGGRRCAARRGRRRARVGTARRERRRRHRAGRCRRGGGRPGRVGRAAGAAGRRRRARAPAPAATWSPVAATRRPGPDAASDRA